MKYKKAKKRMMAGTQSRYTNIIDNYEPPSTKLPNKDGKEVRYEEKNTDLLLEIISRFASYKGGVIMDFYSGTATTAIAALTFGHKFIGFEKDETIKDVVMQRLVKTFHVLVHRGNYFYFFILN